jgi:transcriptional regulator NrdR family protein
VRCPKCESFDTKTIDSRPRADLVYRRHRCNQCRTKYTTNERIVPARDDPAPPPPPTDRELLEQLLGKVEALSPAGITREQVEALESRFYKLLYAPDNDSLERRCKRLAQAVVETLRPRG